MHRRRHVAVQVEGDADLGVPEQLGDDLRVDALPEQQGSGGISEVMEADERQAGRLEQRAEGPVRHVVVVSEAPTLLAKTRPFSCQREPAAWHSSPCRPAWRRSASTATSESRTWRRDFAVFV